MLFFDRVISSDFWVDNAKEAEIRIGECRYGRWSDVYCGSVGGRGGGSDERRERGQCVFNLAKYDGKVEAWKINVQIKLVRLGRLFLRCQHCETGHEVQ